MVVHGLKFSRKYITELGRLSNCDQMYSVERRRFMESGRHDLNKQGVHMKTKELRHKRRKYDGPRKILKLKSYNLIMDSRTVSTGRYGTWFAFRSEIFIDLVRGTEFVLRI